MADYFTNFSLIMPLPDEAAQTYALDLAHAAAGVDGEKPVPVPSRRPPNDVWRIKIPPRPDGDEKLVRRPAAERVDGRRGEFRRGLRGKIR